MFDNKHKFLLSTAEVHPSVYSASYLMLTITPTEERMKKGIAAMQISRSI